MLIGKPQRKHRRLIAALLSSDLGPVWRKVNQALLQSLEAGFWSWPALADQRVGDEPTPESQWLGPLVEFLKARSREEQMAIERLRRLQREFTHLYDGSTDTEERRRHILHFARDLGASRRQLTGDRQAFARWFDFDALTDRYHRRMGEGERSLAFTLERLGTIARYALQHRVYGLSPTDLWQHLALEALVRPMLTYSREPRVRVAAFRCLRSAVCGLPPAQRENSVDKAVLHASYRASLEQGQDVWVQCEALSLLRTLSPSALQPIVRKRLTMPGKGDDLFVRRRLVLALGQSLRECPGLAELLPLALRDPNPFVRQALPKALLQAPAASVQAILGQLALADPVPQVRAAALLALPSLGGRQDLYATVRTVLLQALARESDPFAYRVALKAAVDSFRGLVQAKNYPSTAAADWLEHLLAQLAQRQRQISNVSLRRAIAETREQLWAASLPQRALRVALQRSLQGLSPGEARRLPRRLLQDRDEDRLGRMLAVMTQRDFGIQLFRELDGVYALREPAFGFRWWRFIHELSHGAPDKRQAFSHTLGRRFYGSLRAHSGILAEVSETKVPGEPLLINEESSWRPYLPLVDEVLSSLGRSRHKPVRIFCSEGITELVPPRGGRRRLLAWLNLTLRFSHYAELRNWRENSQRPAAAYSEALRKLGFVIRFRAHNSTDAQAWPADDTVTRFFSAIPFLWVQDLRTWWQRFWDYSLSLYENSVYELVLFLALLSAYFGGRHIYLAYLIRRLRRRLPLVIGGWGTRGKSGTERLKAALINALGYRVVSKTTGCEPMFLYAHPYGTLRELLLFRPYDKVTIWEHFHFMQLATNLGSEVFLWECMALTPAHVEVLQHHWVRDDLSTITNTLPDHEDLQGPAGFNIPEVMRCFIPKSALLITSEEQMLPILEAGAASVGTDLKAVGWLEAGLLTEDVLRRFPYEEHPYNIALVLAMAEALGIDADFALKEIADRVVPDIGVLKAYPEAWVQGRRLSFINGMSANERFSCLSNWRRLGLDRQDPYQQPEVWITTVVNNRADRIQRSRAFAGIVVADISADRHFLIGTNLRGLQDFIGEAWKDHTSGLSLWSGSGDQQPHTILEENARRLRIPLQPEHVTARLRAMLRGIGARPEGFLLNDPEALERQLQERGLAHHSEAILSYWKQEQALLSAYEAFKQRLQTAANTDRPRLDKAFHDLLWEWFSQKLVIIEDPHTGGEQLIDVISTQTPPGLRNRIMGLQNIKGTGLDFIYRWVAWEKIHRACQDLRSGVPALADQGLQALQAFQQFGLLSERHVLETLEAVRATRIARSEAFQAQLRLIEARLEGALQGIREQLAVRPGQGFLSFLAGPLEGFLDAGQAIARRRRADQIYRDLGTERISQERAALELQRLTGQQQGGWLEKRLQWLWTWARKSARETAVGPTTTSHRNRYFGDQEHDDAVADAENRRRRSASHTSAATAGSVIERAPHTFESWPKSANTAPYSPGGRSSHHGS